LIGLPCTVQVANANATGTVVALPNVPSAASSITAGQEGSFLSPALAHSSCLKCKSPPSSVVPFPISCLNCDECSEAYIKTDFDSKTVRCAKCKHVVKAELYDKVDFIKAYYYDTKPSVATTGFKKHQETAYLSMLTDLEQAKNENKHFELKREELMLKEQELERQDAERSRKMEFDQRIEES
jgi:hypothetical protein